MSLKFEREPEPAAILMVLLRRLANLATFTETQGEAVNAVDAINLKLFANCSVAAHMADKFEVEARHRFADLLKGKAF